MNAAKIFVLICAGLLGVIFGLVFIAGIVLLCVYAVPYQCPNMHVLYPGDQGSCNKTAQDTYYSAEVTLTNGSSSLVTYVFDKEPKRIFVDKNYSFKLENENDFRFYIPMVAGSVYKWKINVNDNVDIYFRTPKRGKAMGTIYYKVLAVSNSEGTYAATSSSSSTYFLVSGKNKVSGTFSLSTKWAEWDVTSVTPVDKCTGNQCQWKFSDKSTTADKDLWIITVNEGTKDCDLAMTLKNNEAVWITVPLVMMVLSLVIMITAIVFCALRIS